MLRRSSSHSSPSQRLSLANADPALRARGRPPSLRSLASLPKAPCGGWPGRAPTTRTASSVAPMEGCCSPRNNLGASGNSMPWPRGRAPPRPDPGGRPDQCPEPTAVSVLTPMRTILADRFDGKPLGRLNDLVVDGKGTVYFTVGGAYYVGANGIVKSFGENIRANGIMLSRDEKVVYVTNGSMILAFDILADGTVTNRRDFATLEAGGNGDGMGIDDARRLYVTSAPGVQVFDSAGKYLGVIPTPRSVISVAFSGPRKQTLYVVGSGALGPDG